MAKYEAKIKCPNCNKTSYVYRTKNGRIIVTSISGIVLGAAGGFIGAGIGIVGGGLAMPATIPLAAVGAIVGSGLGYIVSDKTLDKAKCFSCDEPFDLSHI